MGAAARRLTDLDQQGYVDVVDEGLVRRARAGDAQAMDQIIARYRGFVRLKASAYFLAGGDSEDLIQEGLIGLFKAVRDYRPEREASFRSFAELCVTRQIITAIKTAARNKHTPLNTPGIDFAGVLADQVVIFVLVALGLNVVVGLAAGLYELLVEVDVLTSGQQASCLQLDQRRRDQEELGCHVEVQALHALELAEERVDDTHEGNLVDVDLFLKDQVQQEVKGALIDRSAHLVRHRVQASRLGPTAR